MQEFSALNLRDDEITERLSNGSKFFIRTKYANDKAYTGGYTKYFTNLSMGKFRRTDEYDEKKQIFGWGGPRTWKFILKHISVADKILKKGSSSVLDIGCSSGFMRKILENNMPTDGNLVYYGIDAGEHMLKAAVSDESNIESGAVGNRIPSIYVNHDVTKGIPLKDESVDFVTCFEMIKYLEQEDANNLLKEVSRVLKPDGTFFLSTTGILDSENQIEAYINHRNPALKSHWTLDELSNILSRNGMTLVKAFGSESQYSSIKSHLRPEDSETFSVMASFFPEEIMEAVFGFIYPDSTKTKMVVVNKGIPDLMLEVKEMFPDQEVRRIGKEKSLAFSAGDYIVKYLDNKTLWKTLTIYRMLREQTDIRLAELLDMRQSSICNRHMIIMRNEGTDMTILWNGMTEDQKAEIVKEIASMLKRIHSIKVNPTRSSLHMEPGTTSWSKQIEVMFEKHIRKKADLLEKLGVAKELAEIAREAPLHVNNTDYCLIHGDLNIHNLLLGSDGKIVLSLDFETFYCGDKYFDLAVPLPLLNEKQRKMLAELYGVPKGLEKTLMTYRAFKFLTMADFENARVSKEKILGYIYNGAADF